MVGCRPLEAERRTPVALGAGRLDEGDPTEPVVEVVDLASIDEPGLREEPDDAVVEVIAVIAVGRRERLAAYRQAAARLRAERRRRLIDPAG